MWPWFAVYVIGIYSLDRIIEHFDSFALMFCDAMCEWLQMCCEYYFWRTGKLDLALKLALEYGNISSLQIPLVSQISLVSQLDPGKSLWI